VLLLYFYRCNKTVLIMKNLAIFLGMSLSILSLSNVQAQNNADSKMTSHELSIVVPEVALLDIFDANQGTEAGAITLDMSNSNTREAGKYPINGVTYENLYLNYTSVTSNNGSGFDVTRQINVQMEPGSAFPQSLDLRITPAPPQIISGGGNSNTAGNIVSGGVALGTTTPVGTDALLINSIESVYTGDQAYGVKLTYSLEQNGNFESYQAGLYQASLRYTISDF